MEKTALFCDIGNSTLDLIETDFCSYEAFKIPTGDPRRMKDIFETFKDSKRPLHAYISSVDKKGLANLTHVLAELRISSSLLTHARMRMFCKANGYTVSNVDILGTDLFCDIVARKSEKGMIVIDLGTASKILYLNARKEFLGGQIFPGLSSFPEILSVKTDLLGRNELVLDPALVSLETKESISSGAINGGAALIVKMVEEIRKLYQDPDCEVYLTGGNGYLVKKRLLGFGLSEMKTDAHLVNEGLARIYGFENVLSFQEEIR
jgi:type III pantothenate kinase